MSSPQHGNESTQERQKLASLPACEACRKLKMKCTRTETGQNDGTPSSDPCDRCKRTNRPCKIPELRPLGRKRGALGRYRGLEKAYRKLQAEAKKANTSQDTNKSFNAINLPTSEGAEFDSFITDGPSGDLENTEISNAPMIHDTPFLGPAIKTPGTGVIAVEDPASIEGQLRLNHEPMSNPLALLAYASDAAQASEIRPALRNDLSSPIPVGNERFGRDKTEGERLLRRPGYVSLGLQLERGSIVEGLDSLLECVDTGYQSLDYFKKTDTRQRDVGPDLDPIDLGLVTMDEANYLFPIYFTRLHPINGILDPMLHTPEFVRARSSLLFTWILTLTALFDQSSATIAEPLRLHGEKLSRYVHTCGYKSVEIVQGYYISLLSSTPAKTMSEERSWLYTSYAISVATELGIDQEAGETTNSEFSRPQRDQDLSSPLSTSRDSCHISPHEPWNENRSREQRLLRNRERTWLRILLWERANSAACGRSQSFPESNLTRAIDKWWLHPLADMTDKYTSAFIALRKEIASLQLDLKSRSQNSQSNTHWIHDMVDTSLQSWCNMWLPRLEDYTSASSAERASMVFLRYVYEHGRLWTLSLALSEAMSRGQELHEIQQDCFESAVNCCETAVRDLSSIGEPLYCMLAPTWAMISYAAVLTLKLFPKLYGSRVGSDVELLSLLSQLSLQMQRAGTTPSHRFGIAAILGQHLMMILRARAAALKDPQSLQHRHLGLPFTTPEDAAESSQTNQRSPLVSAWDPFLTPAISEQNEVGADGFVDFFREIFGPGLGDLL